MVIKPFKITEMGDRIYHCPVCKATESIKVESSVYYGECSTCNMTLIDYKPLPHQLSFHESKAQYKLNIGGFGSGKTTMSCAELAAHIFQTPKGRAVVVANTLQQLKEAVYPELMKFLPRSQIEREVKSPLTITMKNGFVVMFFASDDQVKLRSLNLTAFYMEEASGIDYAIFDQLQTRLRNRAALIFKDGKPVGYKFLGIISTNPETGWIIDEFLLKSDKIFASKSVDTSTFDMLRSDKASIHYHTFISSTRDNVMLDDDYIARASAGKAQWWINKYIDSRLDIREGAVYPDFVSTLVEPFEIPKSWKRMVGYDPGFRDPTAAPIGAIDPNTGILYVYDLHYEDNRPVSYHAKVMKDRLEGLVLYKPIQADPSVEKRNDDGRHYRSHFRQLSGLDLVPANNDILYGIEKVRDYIERGKLKIFNNLTELKKEGTNYIWKEKTSGKGDVPEDKNNHGLDALRYLITALPDNPNDMYRAIRQSEVLANNNTFESFFDKTEQTRQHRATSRFKSARERRDW